MTLSVRYRCAGLLAGFISPTVSYCQLANENYVERYAEFSTGIYTAAYHTQNTLAYSAYPVNTKYNQTLIIISVKVTSDKKVT